jgi:adenylate cyclase
MHWIKKRTVVHLVIAAILVVPMVGLITVGPDPKQPFASKVRLSFDGLEDSTVDYRIQFGRKAKADPRIVLLSIDDPTISLDALDDQTIAASPPLSLMKSGVFPFPREVYADVCDRLITAGAKVVAFDLIFPNPSPTDAAFQQALDKYRDHVVIGLKFSDDSTSFSLPSASLLPNQGPLDDRLGYINFWRDTAENMVRCAQYRNNVDHLNGLAIADTSPKLYSLAARIVQKFDLAIPVPDDFDRRSMRFAGPSRFSHYSFYQLFDPHSWEKDFQNGEFFRGKIVVVGPSGGWSKDVVSTPIGDLDGVEVHLNAVNDLIQNEFLYPVSNGLIIWIVVVSAAAAFLLAILFVSIMRRFLAGIVVLVGYTIALVLAYNGPGWLLPAVAPLTVFCGALGIGFVYDFTLTQIEKLRLRATFERYHSRNVVKYLLDHTESYKEMLAGTRKPVTVLFSDIRGFTTIAESAPDSHQLVDKLNEYLTGMVACVFNYDGTLGKFMGDGIMAVWGDTPQNFGPKEDAARAVKAALAMTIELKRLNAKWISEGKDEWHIGIGLNHGQVIVGDMGSQQHKEFAVLGDAINLGSRLEGLTKEYKLQILLGESVADLVRDQFHLRSVDVVQVKGKTQAVKTFTVIGEKSEALTSDQQRFLSLHEDGIAAFRERKFDRARELFAQALQLQPGDFLASEYLTSAAAFISNPPDASWTGVRVMTSK